MKRTKDKGFIVGDKATPETCNIWAVENEVVEVIEVSDYSMRIKRNNGQLEYVHPYRWNKYIETKE